MDKAQAKKAIKMIDDVLRKHGVSSTEGIEKIKETIVAEQTADTQITLLMRVRKIILDAGALFVAKILKRLNGTFDIKGKVDVTFPETQKIEGKVSLKDIATLEKTLSTLYRELDRIRVAVGKNESVKVTNFPETQKVIMEGLERLKPKEVQKVKFDKELTLPDIKLTGLEELANENKILRELVQKLVKDGIKTFLAGRDKPDKPIAVQLSDGKDFYKAMARVVTGGRGARVGVLEDENFEVRFENDESGNTIYVGRAAPGTADDASGWKIKKLTYTDGYLTDIKWADGSTATDKVWDSRADYTY